MNDHHVESLKLFWAKDAVERFPDRTCQGAEEIAAYFENLFTAIPDWSLEIVGIAAQGEDVFIQWQATGTHEGRLMGIEPTGKRIAIDGIDHFVVRDARMVSNFIVVDQSGVRPPARDDPAGRVGRRQGDEGGLQPAHEAGSRASALTRAPAGSAFA